MSDHDHQQQNRDDDNQQQNRDHDHQQQNQMDAHPARFHPPHPIILIQEDHNAYPPRSQTSLYVEGCSAAICICLMVILLFFLMKILEGYF